MTDEKTETEIMERADKTYSLFIENSITVNGVMYCHIDSVRAGIEHIHQSIKALEPVSTE